MKDQALCVIPARYASTRLPGKPLLCETGRPLIQHVVENARRASSLTRVVVATDDARIHAAVAGFGGESVMTGEHPNGTSRIAEAVERLGAADELVVNVQGDEPELDPSVIDALVAGLAADVDAPMATLRSRFAGVEDPTDPNVVKVVCDQRGRAMYFSRSLVPMTRDAEDDAATIYKHPGLYAYRRAFLTAYPGLTPTPLERAEKLEQLRVLEHGHAIAVIDADAPEPGIDTAAQYTAFVARWRAARA